MSEDFRRYCELAQHCDSCIENLKISKAFSMINKFESYVTDKGRLHYLYLTEALRETLRERIGQKLSCLFNSIVNETILEELPLGV